MLQSSSCDHFISFLFLKRERRRGRTWLTWRIPCLVFIFSLLARPALNYVFKEEEPKREEIIISFVGYIPEWKLTAAPWCNWSSVIISKNISNEQNWVHKIKSLPIIQDFPLNLLHRSLFYLKRKKFPTTNSIWFVWRTHSRVFSFG
jgi:hypothetical protein